MLDQNTDRMWYVIGAVIVGAAIILLLNNTFPQLFASVGETFKGKTEQTTEVVDGIMPKVRPQQVYNKDIQVSSYPALAEVVAYDEDAAMWELAIHAPVGSHAANNWSAGLSIQKGLIEVPYGATLTISYDVWSPIDTSAKNDVNNDPVEGKLWSKGALNDNDDTTKRWSSSATIPANEWKTITFSYENTSPLNVNKISLYDYSTFGAFNPTTSPITIKIKNVTTTVTLDE